jgi:hypothetical protein
LLRETAALRGLVKIAGLIGWRSGGASVRFGRPVRRAFALKVVDVVVPLCKGVGVSLELCAL